MGFALYIDGHYVPNIEMAHHVFRKHKTYEQRIGNAALHKVGRRRWNKRVQDAIEHLEPVFNYRVLYLGGGNSKVINFSLPANVRVIENVSGLLGGIYLWQPRVADTSGGLAIPAAVPPSPVKTPPKPSPAAKR